MTYISIVAYFPWFIVIVLMLRIFLKYAKPSKDELNDDEERIQDALLDRFQNQPGSEEEKFKRRQKAYKDMADLEIK